MELRRPRDGYLALLAAVATFALATAPASAETFTVDRAGDVSPVPSTCDPATANDCSLRGAITKANTTGGPDQVAFGINGVFEMQQSGAPEQANASGDFDITQSLTITGNGPANTVVDANDLDRVFDVLGASSAVTFSGMTIRDGTAAGSFGAGVRVDPSASGVTLTDTVLSENTADFGAGLYTPGAANLTRVTVADNVAASDGGGIYVQSGALTLIDSALEGNQAADSAGGLEVDGGTAVLTNVTVSGNFAQGSGVEGGGIDSSGALTLTNVTLASNQTPTGTGKSLALNNGGTATLRNTILAYGVGQLASLECAIDNGGTFTSSGGNLGGDASCNLVQTADQQNTDPRLEPLQQGSGPTPTHPLLAGSPAIDAGLTAGCPPADQRGVARQDGDGDGSVGCDVGAHERERSDPPSPPDSRPPALELTAKRTQAAGKPIKVKATADEPCELELSGTAKPKGEPKGRLKPAAEQLGAGVSEGLKLKLGALKAALREADAGKAKLRATCRDAAGNTGADRLSVKLN